MDTKRRRALFRNRQSGQSRSEHYESLVSTIPVPELLRRCVDMPAHLKEAAEGLRWVSFTTLIWGSRANRSQTSTGCISLSRNIRSIASGFP